MPTIAQIIDRFQLSPLTGEGGLFRRTYCSTDLIPAEKAALLPEDGILLDKDVTFTEGESAYTVILRALQQEKLHYEADKSNYLMAIGKTAKAIRAERGAKPTDTASDFLTSDELLLVEDFTNRVGVMIDAGLDYKTIKAALQKRLTAKEAS